MDETLIDTTAPPSGEGCLECEANGGWWVRLRRCATCGHIGCCDSSPGKHSTGHFEETGHRYMQSFEPGESWYWDFVDSRTFDEGPELAAPTSHPGDRPAAGPEDRLPANWRTLI